MAAPGEGTDGPGSAKGPSHAHPDALDDLEDGCKRAENGNARRGLSTSGARWRWGPGGGGRRQGPTATGPHRRPPAPVPPAHLIRKPRK